MSHVNQKSKVPEKVRTDNRSLDVGNNENPGERPTEAKAKGEGTFPVRGDDTDL